MAFKDMLNKGISMISEGAKNAKKAAQEKKQAIQDFDLLKTSSNHIGPMEPYAIHNPEPQAGRQQTILTLCLTINVENSKVVNKLIPLEETILDVKTSKEAKTEIQYTFVITDKKLWVLNQNEYKTYSFESIANCEIINKGLMSHGVKFDNNAFQIDGSEADVKRFIEILMNKTARDEDIAKKTAYLCGIVPRKQLLNMANRGITLGDNGKIVLHSGFENRLLNIEDIKTVQLLVNDSVTLSKGITDSGNFVSSPMEARKMSVKFVLAMGEFTINILEQNMMNSTYKREDATYINNYDFARKIVDTVIDCMRGNTVIKTNIDTFSSDDIMPALPKEQNITSNTPVNQTTVQPTSASVPIEPSVAPTSLDPFGVANSEPRSQVQPNNQSQLNDDIRQ